MKKVSIAILAVIYLVVSSGVAMSIHYCMGKVASVDLVHSNEKCSKCGMKTNTGCCKNEFKIVKLSDSHKLITNDIRIITPVAEINNSISLLDDILYSKEIQADYNIHAPPGSSGVPLNILYCVFRI